MADAQITLTAKDSTKAAFDSVIGRMGDLKTAATAISSVLAFTGLAAALEKVTGGVKDTIDQWDELGKAAQRSGFDSAQALAEFQFAAKVSGVETAGLEMAIGKLSTKMADAAGGSDKAAAVFKTLGVKIKDSTGELRSTDAVLGDLAARFASWKDGPQKSALALDLFGKSGKELIPLLNRGADGLEDLRTKFAELRGEVSNESTKAADEFRVNLAKLEAASGGLKRHLAEELLPTLVRITEAMVKAREEGGKYQSWWVGFKTATNELTKDKFGTGLFDTKALADQAQGLKTLRDEITRLQLALRIGLGGDQVQQQLNAKLQEFDQAKAMFRAADAQYRVQHAGFYDIDAGDAQSRRLAAGSAKSAAPIVNKADDGDDSIKQYDALIKRINERISLDKQEVQSTHTLNEEEKFAIKIRSDLIELQKKHPELSNATIEALLKESAAWSADNEKKKEAAKYAQQLGKFFQDQDAEIAAAAKARTDERDRLLAGLRQQHDALEDNQTMLQAEAALMGETDEKRQAALGVLQIELATKREIQKVNQNLLLGEEERAIVISKVNANADVQKAQVQQRVALDETQRQLKSFDDTAKNVWMNMWEKGSDVLKNLGKLIKTELLDMIYQLALRPIVLNIGANILGATGSLTAAAGSGAVQGGISSLLSGGSALAGGGGIGSLLGAGAGATLQNGLISGFGANMSNIGTLLGGGEFMTALSAAAPYLLPIAGAAMLISSLLKKGGGPKVDGTYGLLGSTLGLGTHTADSDSAAKAAVAALQTTYGGVLGAYGRTGGANFGLGFSTDPKGTSPSFLDVSVGRGGALDTLFGSRTVGRSQEELQTAIQQYTGEALIKALQEEDLPGKIGDILKSLGDVSTKSAAEITDAIAAINTQVAKDQAIAQQRAQMQEQILTLSSSAAENEARAQKKVLDGLDDSLKPLQLQINALQDQKTAAVAAAAALAENNKALVGQVDAAYGIYTDTLKSNVDLLKQTVSAEQQRAASLKQYLRELTVGPAALNTPAKQYARTRAEFERLSRLAPNDAERKDNIQQAGQDFLTASQTYNASSMAYFVDLAKVKGVVEASQVAAVAGTSIAQAQLSVAQSQLDALLGVQGNTLTIAQALDKLTTTLFDALSKGATTINPSALAAVTGKLAPEQWTGNIYKSSGGAAASVVNGDLTIVGKNAVAYSVNDIVAGATNLINDGNTALLEEKRKILGLTKDDLLKLGVPSYDVGQPYVPYDQLARIHRREAVLKPDEADAWRAGRSSGNADALAQRIDALGARLEAAIQQNTLVTASAGSATAGAIDRMSTEVANATLLQKSKETA